MKRLLPTLFLFVLACEGGLGARTDGARAGRTYGTISGPGAAPADLSRVLSTHPMARDDDIAELMVDIVTHSAFIERR